MNNNRQGARLAGHNFCGNREVNDYYATPYETTAALLDVEQFEGTILEPACGSGHIVQVLSDYGYKIHTNDIIDRGYGSTFKDFLTSDFKMYDNIITNPPFKYAKDFVEKSLELSRKKVAMLLKIQFLEGISRRELFDTTPLRSVYVFTKRQTCLKNGLKFDENGKKWTGTLCYAWFIWEHGYDGKPTIEWL